MSAGTLAGFVINFLIVGFIYGCLGVVCDYIIRAANSSITPIGLSQDCLNTLTTLSYIFKILPVLYLLALIVNHYIESTKDSIREV
jgi:hypothetical protein